MAYAQAFLTKEKKMMFPLEKTDTLKSIFKYVLTKSFMYIYTKSITSVDILTSFRSIFRCGRSIRFIYSDLKLLCSVNRFLFATILLYSELFDKKKNQIIMAWLC